jgi:DNA-3-methyladenine glycosylase
MLDFLEQGAVSAAEQLIGWRFYKREVSGELVGGIIIETEAYDQTDAASHSFNGKTQRNLPMFGEAGQIYVYFTYGMHYCINIVTGNKESGEAVLIRALLPESGIEVMQQRRKQSIDQLTSGPAKICQALNINKSDNAKIINKSEFILKPPLTSFTVKRTTRIGIKKEVDRLWRFVANLES